MTDSKDHVYDDDPLVEDGVLTPIGTPRCQVAAGSYGRGQCPHSGDRIAVTAMSAVPHLTIRVCAGHAEELVRTPGWGVRL